MGIDDVGVKRSEVLGAKLVVAGEGSLAHARSTEHEPQTEGPPSASAAWNLYHRAVALEGHRAVEVNDWRLLGRVAPGWPVHQIDAAVLRSCRPLPEGHRDICIVVTVH